MATSDNSPASLSTSLRCKIIRVFDDETEKKFASNYFMASDAKKLLMNVNFHRNLIKMFYVAKDFSKAKAMTKDKDGDDGVRKS